MKNTTNVILLLLLTAVFCSALPGYSRDLEEVRRQGILRHLGVPYANFVTGDGRGLSVELIQRFADYLGVRYTFVESSWKTIVDDLARDDAKGDLIANGLTILPWREKILDFSCATFPTQVWLITSSRSSLVPIVPSGSIAQDIAEVKSVLVGKTLLGLYNTCLDPNLYGVEKDDVQFTNFTGSLNELIPAVIQGKAETALIDVPDALVSLVRWPGQFKIIGPISPPQRMGVAFPQNAPHLRAAFNKFLETIWADGTYRQLVKKYYPDVFDYYPGFFKASKAMCR